MADSSNPSSTTNDEQDIGDPVRADAPVSPVLKESAAHTSPEAVQPPMYSIYTRRQKHFIVFMSSLGGFFSPLSANTYLPGIPKLSASLQVSTTLINLTVTAFLIFQGLAPSFYGDFADMAGRRPAYLVSFIIYVAANIGLATQSSYPALFVLRCLQVRKGLIFYLVHDHKPCRRSSPPYGYLCFQSNMIH